MADAESRGGDALKALASHIGNARPDNVFPDSALNGMGAEGAVDLSALQDAIDTHKIKAALLIPNSFIGCVFMPEPVPAAVLDPAIPHSGPDYTFRAIKRKKRALS